MLAVFRLPQLLYRRGWGWLLGDTFLLLVHAGRKTGKRYSTVAMVFRYEPHTREAVICSAWGQDADWIRNIRAHPALQVQIGRQSFIPQQRFLSQDESLAVLAGFRHRHPHRSRFSHRFWAGETSARMLPPTSSSAPGHSSPCALSTQTTSSRAARTMSDPAHERPPAPDTPATGPDSEDGGTGPAQRQPGADGDGLLAVVKNLSRYHREHEKYYSEAPLADAIALQRTARTLIALAERWASVEPAAEPAPSPFAGTPDLNDDRAIETSGVLFMEGEGEPAEISRIKSELETIAASSEQSGSWLAAAMEASWGMAEALLAYPQLADLLGERHKIIGNNWQNACTAQLVARYLRRAVTVMERVDFSPAALRKNLASARSAPAYLYAAAELINHAADLAAASSVLTHENERRWRIFHQRTKEITANDNNP